MNLDFIGVDDAFLILGAWRVTNAKLPPHKRLAITMSEAGASITITTLTDGLCFGLGAVFCQAPAVSNFCMFTAVAVVFDFAYQISFFVAIVIYGGRREARGEPACVCCGWNREKAPPTGEIHRVQEVLEKSLNQPSKMETALPEFSGNGTLMHKLLGKYYAPMVCKTEVRWFTLFLYTLYASVCLYGCFTLRVSINPKKFVLDNSHLQRYFDISEQYLWSDNVEPAVFILRPPDFRVPDKLRRFLRFVTELESTEFSSGADSTNLWLREYLRFISDFIEANLSRDFYNKTYLGEFFLQEYAEQYRKLVKFQDSLESSDQSLLSAFQFKTSFYRLDTWEKRRIAVQMWREICAKYPDFQASVFDVINGGTDQVDTIAPSAIQTIGLAVIAMTIISAAFIPHKLSVFYVTLSLLSITMGVIGGLSLWDCDLDPVSLSCILMSIGFAVDFSAHICYRYHRAHAGRPIDKLVETIGHVGWPIIQAALSSLLGVSVLAFVPAYLVRIFFKTATLVFFSGLMHALLFLPALQTTLDLSSVPKDRFRKRKNYSRNS